MAAQGRRLIERSGHRANTAGRLSAGGFFANIGLPTIDVEALFWPRLKRTFRVAGETFFIRRS
jgi:hypothetical protein